MILSERILGKGTAHTLRERGGAPLLVIGSDIFSRQALSAIDCWSDRAAVNLSNRIKHLDIKNTRHLFESVSPETLAIPGLGAFSMAVLGAAFEIKKLGTLEDWNRKHLKDRADLVSFISLKRRDAQESAEERKRAKARKAARRNTAHRHRVARFEQRAG